MAEPFRNWSGSVEFTPRRHHEAASEEELAEILAAASERGGQVRPVGSGHSSSPLVTTADELVSIGRMSGLIEHNADECLATLHAGTTLEEATHALHEVGMAFENLGDVTYQTLAGAVGTGTHGTGTGFGNLSSNVVGGRLVTAGGDVVAFGTKATGEGQPEADGDLVRAARLSLGALGILSSVTLRVIPAIRLHRRTWITEIDWTLQNFERLTAEHRHVDFYWYPRSDEVQIRILDEPQRMPAQAPPGDCPTTEETGPNWHVIPQDRDLKFEEMEYMLPISQGLAAFAEVRERVKSRHRRTVGWRVLVRTVAGDDAFLSNCPAPTMTIAVLHNHQLPYEEYFGDIEPVLRAGGGRPHWGKKHTATASDLVGMYSHWEQFQTIRRRLDPEGLFMNDHLRTLFGEESA